MLLTLAMLLRLLGVRPSRISLCVSPGNRRSRVRWTASPLTRRPYSGLRHRSRDAETHTQTPRSAVSRPMYVSTGLKLDEWLGWLRVFSTFASCLVVCVAVISPSTNHSVTVSVKFHLGLGFVGKIGFEYSATEVFECSNNIRIRVEINHFKNSKSIKNS